MEDISEKNDDEVVEIIIDTLKKDGSFDNFRREMLDEFMKTDFMKNMLAQSEDIARDTLEKERSVLCKEAKDMFPFVDRNLSKVCNKNRMQTQLNHLIHASTSSIEAKIDELTRMALGIPREEPSPASPEVVDMEVDSAESSSPPHTEVSKNEIQQEIDTTEHDEKLKHLASDENPKEKCENTSREAYDIASAVNVSSSSPGNTIINAYEILGKVERTSVSPDYDLHGGTEKNSPQSPEEMPTKDEAIDTLESQKSPEPEDLMESSEAPKDSYENETPIEQELPSGDYSGIQSPDPEPSSSGSSRQSQRSKEDYEVENQEVVENQVCARKISPVPEPLSSDDELHEPEEIEREEEHELPTGDYSAIQSPDPETSSGGASRQSPTKEEKVQREYAQLDHFNKNARDANPFSDEGMEFVPYSKSPSALPRETRDINSTTTMIGMATESQDLRQEKPCEESRRNSSLAATENDEIMPKICEEPIKPELIAGFTVSAPSIPSPKPNSNLESPPESLINDSPLEQARDAVSVNSTRSENFAMEVDLQSNNLQDLVFGSRLSSDAPSGIDLYKAEHEQGKVTDLPHSELQNSIEVTPTISEAMPELSMNGSLWKTVHGSQSSSDKIPMKVGPYDENWHNRPKNPEVKVKREMIQFCSESNLDRKPFTSHHSYSSTMKPSQRHYPLFDASSRTPAYQTSHGNCSWLFNGPSNFRTNDFKSFELHTERAKVIKEEISLPINEKAKFFKEGQLKTFSSASLVEAQTAPSENEKPTTFIENHFERPPNIQASFSTAASHVKEMSPGLFENQLERSVFETLLNYDPPGKIDSHIPRNYAMTLKIESFLKKLTFDEWIQFVKNFICTLEDRQLKSLFEFFVGRVDSWQQLPRSAQNFTRFFENSHMNSKINLIKKEDCLELYQKAWNALENQVIQDPAFQDAINDGRPTNRKKKFAGTHNKPVVNRDATLSAPKFVNPKLRHVQLSLLPTQPSWHNVPTSPRSIEEANLSSPDVTIKKAIVRRF